MRDVFFSYFCLVPIPTPEVKWKESTAAVTCADLRPGRAGAAKPHRQRRVGPRSGLVLRMLASLQVTG